MSTPADVRLPVHGFVLAGGRSSRMGRDKALLSFRGRPMVEIAAEKLRSFCPTVAIAGNREDLQHIASVVPELRRDHGPIAGIEASLRAAVHPWALFVPVDVPLFPASLLANWTRAVVQRAGEGVKLSFLRAGGEPHPAFCLLHRECAEALTAAVDRGTLKLAGVFNQVALQLGPRALWAADAETFARAGGDGPALDLEACFANVNTPEDLLVVETASEQFAPAL